MEVIPLADGKYTVLLNGAAYTNCTRDVDCPTPRARCYRGVAWLPPNATGLCACPLGLWTSGTCGDMLPDARAAMAVGAATLCLAALCVGLALATLRRLRRARVRFFPPAALVFATEAGLATGVLLVIPPAVIMDWINPESPFPFQATPAGDLDKPGSDAVFATALSLIFLSTITSCLSISLAWIDVATPRAGLGPSRQSQVTRLRRGILVYSAFLSLGAVASLALKNYIVAGACALPGVLFVALSYAVGARRVLQSAQVRDPTAREPAARNAFSWSERRVKGLSQASQASQTSQASHGMSPAGPASRVSQASFSSRASSALSPHALHSLEEIRMAGAAISVLAWLLLIAFVLFVGFELAVGGSPRSGTETYHPSLTNPVIVSGVLVHFFIGALQAAVLAYAWRRTRGASSARSPGKRPISGPSPGAVVHAQAGNMTSKTPSPMAPSPLTAHHPAGSGAALPPPTTATPPPRPHASGALQAEGHDPPGLGSGSVDVVVIPSGGGVVL